LELPLLELPTDAPDILFVELSNALKSLSGNIILTLLVIFLSLSPLLVLYTLKSATSPTIQLTPNFLTLYMNLIIKYSSIRVEFVVDYKFDLFPCFGLIG
jgi:hypothetical protein